MAILIEAGDLADNHTMPDLVRSHMELDPDLAQSLLTSVSLRTSALWPWQPTAGDHGGFSSIVAVGEHMLQVADERLCPKTPQVKPVDLSLGRFLPIVLSAVFNDRHQHQTRNDDQCGGAPADVEAEVSSCPEGDLWPQQAAYAGKKGMHGHNRPSPRRCKFATINSTPPSCRHGRCQSRSTQLFEPKYGIKKSAIDSPKATLMTMVTQKIHAVEEAPPHHHRGQGQQSAVTLTISRIVPES